MPIPPAGPEANLPRAGAPGSAPFDAAALRRAVAEAAAATRRWADATNELKGMSDAAVEAARADQGELAERLAGLVPAVEALEPPDLALVATVHQALLHARHGVTWADWVLHERLPAADPMAALGLEPGQGPGEGASGATEG